uniref:Uridine kinase n=1 Tax=Albugo laibachii Nc14 TaxID=890382 RepID=F0WGQ0_9STRA|nr:uridine kinase putative [Albugo laibachii Nc14]|eukprot:CCA20414.1 uridine kinase putative [Albugo laibachii Nc14]
MTHKVNLILFGTFLVAVYWLRSRKRCLKQRPENGFTQTQVLKPVFCEPKDLKLVDPYSEYPLIQDNIYTNSALDLIRSKPQSEASILVVGVCGGSGSGKTTLSKAIIRDFGLENVTYLSHDFYYKDLSHLTLEERANHNFDHPDALETSLLVSHLKTLKEGQRIEIPVYDFTTHTRKKQSIVLEPRNIILLEGILIFAQPELLSLMDIKVFVETAADIRLLRRLRRDMGERNRTAETVMAQYMKNVRPMHMTYVETSKRFADIIIPHGVNSVALDMIISKLHRFTNTACHLKRPLLTEDPIYPKQVHL